MNPTHPIPLDQWIALNDEIVALVRAGVPLEVGLAGLARELQEPQRRTALKISEGLSRGESLPQVLADPGVGCPPLYRAVVEAGLRSGRLAVALEQLAAAARRLAELRGSVGRALVYPLLVVVVASLLMLFFAQKVAPVLADGMRDFNVRGAELFSWLVYSRSFAPWLLLVPLLALAAACTWWIVSGASLALQPAWSRWAFAWVPGARRMLIYGRAATLTEVAALLVEQQTPLDEALCLAAASTGDSALAKNVAELATALRAGLPLPEAARGLTDLPPFLIWLLGTHAATSGAQGGLATALRHTADSYRRRALHQAELARILTPVLLTFGVSGAVTLAYALTLFVPWTTLLRSLAA